MATSYKTPGVYIQEVNAFPGSIVAVETAIPVFIGYTEVALRDDKSLINFPTRITSLSEYVKYFCKDFKARFKIEIAGPTATNAFDLNGVLHELVIDKKHRFYLYNSIRLFYANGGGTCYILSVNTYGDKPNGLAPNETDFINALEVLKQEYEPTLIIMPDATTLDNMYTNIYTAALGHCGEVQNRIAIFDLAQQSNSANFSSNISDFKLGIGNNFLNYGVAYFPWLNTSIVQQSEVDFENIDLADFRDLMAYLPEPNVRNVLNDSNKIYADLLTVLKSPRIPASTEDDDKVRKIKDVFHQSLMGISPTYKTIIEQVRYQMNQLPPSGTVAGVYALVDNTRGVWKAPANVSVSMVNSPVVNITQAQQEGLNVDATSGKSINVIRSFPGIGTLIWGARTLDGNSQDWRYVNVRRTLIMIEQSIKLATKAYVFEPNDANTWVTIKSMIDNFLFNLWKQGCLVGSKPEESYNVSIGLGSTMTAQDILDGYLRVSVLVAIVRPAEFIVITFQQQMQQS